MASGGITLDDVAEVADCSPSTLLALAVRLDRSSTFQEHIAREIELDEVWRRVETVLKAANEDRSARAKVRMLQVVFGLVSTAHDLAGAGQPREAADRLRQAVALQESPERGLDPRE